MTLTELYMIRDITKEIEEDRSRIDRIEKQFGKEAAEEIRKAIEVKTVRLLEAYSRATAYISTVDDSHVRRILSLRFIDCRSWQYIAAKLGGRVNANGVRMMCNRFVKRNG